MRASRLSLAAIAISWAWVVAAPAAVAQEAPATCAYPYDCMEGEDDGRSSGGGSGSTTSATVLPFTGGEAVLMGLTGAGAVAAGGLLLVAGRKRSRA